MEGSRGPYAGAGISPEMKEYVATLVAALLDEGVALDTIIEALEKTKYAPKKRTLQLHVKRIREGEEPLSAQKRSGAKKKVSDEEWAIVAGWILLSSEIVDLPAVQTFLSTELDRNVSLPTISRSLKLLNLTLKLTSTRPRTKNVSANDFAVQYFAYLLQLRESLFFNHDHKHIMCIDFVTNSRRLERRKTFALKGAPQPKVSRADTPVYTNSYLVCVNMLGEMLPPLMFTYDPTFRPGGRHEEDVKKWCREYKISDKQIIFTESTKKYCKEAVEQVDHFMHVYAKNLQHAHILHDAGNSFKVDKDFLLMDKAKKVVELNPETHGAMSVLDNKTFAIAKQRWRAERPTDSLSRADLFLMRCIMDVKPKVIQGFWIKNFFLNTKELKQTEVADHIQGVPKLRKALVDNYIESYESWLEEQGKCIEEQQLAALESKLDGAYWVE